MVARLDYGGGTRGDGRSRGEDIIDDEYVLASQLVGIAHLEYGPHIEYSVGFVLLRLTFIVAFAVERAKITLDIQFTGDAERNLFRLVVSSFFPL